MRVLFIKTIPKLDKCLFSERLLTISNMKSCHWTLILGHIKIRWSVTQCDGPLSCMILQHHPTVIWKMLVCWVMQTFRMLTQFHYTTFKKIASPISSEMSLRIGKLLSSWWQIQVFKTLIFSWEMDVVICNKYSQLLSLKSIHSFSGRILPNLKSGCPQFLSHSFK